MPLTHVNERGQYAKKLGAKAKDTADGASLQTGFKSVAKGPGKDHGIMSTGPNGAIKRGS